LLQRAADRLRADVLLVPHHGSKTSSTPAFIEAVQPKVAIFTVGYRNRFGHPKAEVVGRYRAQGARVLRSDADGAVTVRLAPQGVKKVEVPEVIAWRGARQRYWQAPVRIEDYSPER
jgi:competence protein ComEC